MSVRFIHAVCNCICIFSSLCSSPCTSTNNLLCYSTANRYLSCFHFWAKTNSAVTNSLWMHIYTFFFFWLGSSLGVELLSWAFVVISKWFSKMIVPIYTSVNSVCFTSSPTLYNLPFFILSILRNWCELVSHCGFNSHFSDGEWCWAVFHVLIGRVSMLFCEVPVHVFSPFSTGLFLLFLMDL